MVTHIFKAQVLDALLSNTSSSITTLAVLLQDTLNAQYVSLWRAERYVCVACELALNTPHSLISAITTLNDTPTHCPPHSVLSSGQDELSSDILANKNWSALHHEAQQHQIQNCLALVVKNSADGVAGVITLFNLADTSLSKQQQKHQAIVCQAIAQILQQQACERQLRALQCAHDTRVAQQKVELSEVNLLLKKAITQRNKVQEQLVEMDSMSAFTTMLSSLTHEMSSPLGAAITATTHLAAVTEHSEAQFNKDALKKSELRQLYHDTNTTLTIIKRNIDRADQLIRSFEQLAQDQHLHSTREINLSQYLTEVLLSLKPKIKTTPHRFCLDVPSDLTLVCHPGAIGQVLTHLILNSIEHAFPAKQAGKINIQGYKSVSEQQAYLTLIYSDDGRGMAPDRVANLYKPFFSLSNEGADSGLGMHICYNIVVKLLRGTIDCHSVADKGVRFEINVPIGKSQ